MKQRTIHSRNQGKSRAASIYAALEKAMRIIERLESEPGAGDEDAVGFSGAELSDARQAIDNAKKIIETEL